VSAGIEREREREREAFPLTTTYYKIKGDGNSSLDLAMIIRLISTSDSRERHHTKPATTSLFDILKAGVFSSHVTREQERLIRLCRNEEQWCHSN
jgi:hypothetical protein